VIQPRHLDGADWYRAGNQFFPAGYSVDGYLTICQALRARARLSLGGLAYSSGCFIFGALVPV
jgi:hypothetical protein